MQKRMKQQRIEEIRDSALKILEKGLDLKGAASSFNREDFYDEVLKHRLGKAYRK
jgi:hypothetical protein